MNELKRYRRKEDLPSNWVRIFRAISTENYYIFCKKHGYKQCKFKSLKQLTKEHELFRLDNLELKKQKAISKLNENNPKRKIIKKFKRDAISLLIERKLLSEDFTKNWEALSSEEQTNLKDILQVFKRFSKEFTKPKQVDVVSKFSHLGLFFELVKEASCWDFHNFKIKGTDFDQNLNRFLSFVHNGFPQPIGLIDLLFKKKVTQVLSIYKGGSFKSEIKTNIIISKKRSSEIFKLLTKYKWDKALRKSQLNWLNVPEYLHKTILDLQIANEGSSSLEIKKRDFFLFLSKDNMLNSELILPLWDYATQVSFVDPSFSFKGRTLYNYIEMMEEWHFELSNVSSKNNFFWEPCGIAPYSVKVKTSICEKIVVIKELTSRNLLVKEGRDMKHCIASYASKCKEQHTSVWSLYDDVYGSINKMVTIEVDVLMKRVVQVRGKLNRVATSYERSVISKWANNNGLTYVS